MLGTFLKGATAAKLPLEFVGGVGINDAGSTSITVPLTGLSGGFASSPSAGDIVICAVGFNDTTDRTMSTSGYTKVVDLFNVNAQLGVFHKILTAADTSLDVSGVGSRVQVVVHVWRNPNSTSPLDTSAVTSTQSSSIPNCPAITTVTDGAVVLAISFASNSAANSSTISAPSGMGNFFSGFRTVTSGGGAYIASRLVTPAGAYDPPVFSGSSPNIDRVVNATIAIRPK